MKKNQNKKKKIINKKILENFKKELIIEKKEGKLYETILKNYLNPLIDNKDVFKR